MKPSYLSLVFAAVFGCLAMAMGPVAAQAPCPEPPEIADPVMRDRLQALAREVATLSLPETELMREIHGRLAPLGEIPDRGIQERQAAFVLAMACRALQERADLPTPERETRLALIRNVLDDVMGVRRAMRAEPESEQPLGEAAPPPMGAEEEAAAPPPVAHEMAPKEMAPEERVSEGLAREAPLQAKPRAKAPGPAAPMASPNLAKRAKRKVPLDSAVSPMVKMPSGLGVSPFAMRESPAPAGAKGGDCVELGQIGSDCTDFEAIIQKLKVAPLAYNHPDTMYLGRRTQISLVLKTGAEDLKSELEGLSGQVKEAKTRISRIMQAELRGAAFKIEPSGPQKKVITSLANVRWDWFVTPLEPGSNKPLVLELSAILREGTKELPPVAIRTFKAKITVDVKWWDRLLYEVRALDPLYQLAGAIGGLASALLLVWRVVRRFGRKKPAD